MTKEYYRVSIKSLYNFKELLQRQMMRQRNEGCFMLISISLIKMFISSKLFV